MENRAFDYFKDKYTLPGAREKFESSCSQLLQSMYSEESVHRIEVSRGDEGIDILVLDTEAKKVAKNKAVEEGNAFKDEPYIAVYQCKYFVDKMNSSRWGQVKDSFKRAKDSKEYKLTKWILCVSRTFTWEEMKHWEKWSSEASKESGIPIELMDGDNLIASMKKGNIYNEIFDIEDSIKLDRLYQKTYGPYDIISQYRSKRSCKLPKSFEKLENLQRKYFEGNISNEDISFNDFNTIVKNDLTNNKITSEEKNHLVAHWHYWCGMIQKNLFQKEDQAKVSFEKSSLGISDLELYKYYKKKRKEMKEASDKEKKNVETQANNSLKSACDKNIAEAYFTDAENIKANIDENLKNHPEISNTDLWDSIARNLYIIAGEHLIKKSLISEDFLKAALNQNTDSDSLNNLLCPDTSFTADALYWLQKYNTEFSSQYHLEDNVKNEIFEESLYLGCNHAYDDSTQLGNPLTPSTARAFSVERGICYINTENERSEWFEKSMPENWKMQNMAREKDLLWATFSVDIPIRFLFIDDNLQKNMLESIKLLENLRQKSEKIVSTDIEIFIRCKVAQAAPIIDTFQNCMKGHKIPVHLIDEDRMAAQQLFSKHPLFYPTFRNRTNGKSSTYYEKHLNIDVEKTPIHLTIVGNNDCALWMIREASWMMCLPQESDKVRMSGSITVLGEHAWELEEQFKTLCPGLHGDYRESSESKASIKGKDTTEALESWLPLPNYTFHNVGSKTETFSTLLSSEFFPTNYIVVCDGNDMENMETAIRIRQLMVRKYKNNPEEMPVIAYYCEDSYLAYIGKRTVIDNEKLGHKWSNNYQLIPFGPWQIYNWKNLMQDLTEDISKCVHLAYCGSKPGDKAEDKKNALISYYDREYNRDSSRAIALSLPYRLYVTALSKKTAKEEQNKLLEKYFHRWRFEDDDYFYTDAQAKRIADILMAESHFEKTDKNTYVPHLFEESEIEKMKIWEHNRWTCWMLSRGHLPMSTTRMINFVNMGHNRQNLAIGKLHALICPFKDISKVEQMLSIARDDNKKPGYLQDLDIELVQRTPDFWKRSWLKEK